MASKLTFITTTGSRLDDDSVKEMRRHVTKENFRQRRRRKAMKSHDSSQVENDTSDAAEMIRGPETRNFSPRSDRTMQIPRKIKLWSPITEPYKQYHPDLIAYCTRVFFYL